MQDFHSAIRILSTGQIQAGSLVTKRFSLADTAAAFDYAAQGAGLKALVIPDPEARARAMGRGGS